MYINIFKATYDKPIVYIILNGKTKAFPLMSSMRPECPLSQLFFNIVLEFIAREMRKFIQHWQKHFMTIYKTVN
jgi:hypothetical protein